jgi:hypothetical protein
MDAFKPIGFFKTLKQKLQLKFLFWHYLFLVLFFLALPFLAGILPIVRFTEEQIDIRIYPDYVLLHAIYVYQNPFPFPVVQGLSVPFPVDNDHPTPVQLTARQLVPKRKNLETRYILGRHRFNLFFNASEQIQISVEYSPDGYHFTVVIPPEDVPFFPYNHMTAVPSYRADETGQIRMIRANRKGQLCPVDAPVIMKIDVQDLNKEMRLSS